MNTHRGLIISEAKWMSPCCNFIWVVLFLIGWFIFFICCSEQMGRQTRATDYSLLVWVSIMFAGKVCRAGRTLANRHSARGRTPCGVKSAEPHGRQQPRKEWLQFFMCLFKVKLLRLRVRSQRNAPVLLPLPARPGVSSLLSSGSLKNRKVEIVRQSWPFFPFENT